MKIFALIGSNNKNGNTSKVVNLTVSVLKDKLEEKKKATSVLVNNISDYECVQCSGCMKCFFGEKCHLSDDLYKIKNDLLENDIIILSTPIYLNFISGSLKVLFDRLAYWSHLMPLIGRKAIIVVTTSNSGIQPAINYMELICAYFGLSTVATIALKANEINKNDISKLINDKVVDNIINNKYKSNNLEMVFNYYYEYYLNMSVNTNEKEYWIENYLSFNNLDEVLSSISYQKNYSKNKNT